VAEKDIDGTRSIRSGGGENGATLWICGRVVPCARVAVEESCGLRCSVDGCCAAAGGAKFFCLSFDTDCRTPVRSMLVRDKEFMDGSDLCARIPGVRCASACGGHSLRFR
jgi:hypothetical protein